jgi:eukaryotic-like serine/threonine-protein kinase
MADGKTRLQDGEQIRMRLVMPDFPGRLRVDYLAHDGSVQHLYPQLAASPLTRRERFVPARRST